ncbi:MAG: glycosyltransferase [Clostridia bacterium]|nr:glycosyltransferase [Clostridia bacterium]
MLISIIIPVYNAEDYIEECVKSVLSQTYKDIELLLINDGSTDKTGEMLDLFPEKDERVRVFHKENGGTHTARNLGLDNAKGEYVMFMDPDDWLSLDTVERLAEKIKEYDLDEIRFNYIREFKDVSLKKENKFLKESLYSGDECRELFRQTVGLIDGELRNPENLNFLASVCFGAYRKSIIKENNIQFFNIREIGTFSDGLFNIEFSKHLKKFLFLDEGFYHYRKTNTSSATKNYRENFMKKQALLFDKIYELIKDEKEDVLSAYYNRIAIGTMELCLNALKQKGKTSKKYREIKEVLKDELHIKALKKLKISLLPLKWKVYFSLIKMRSALGVYFMSAVILKLMNRG